MSEPEKHYSKPERVRIIPPKERQGAPTLTQGTRVVTQSGIEVGNVNRVELIADVNDVWRAQIHLNVDPAGVESIVANAVFVPVTSLKWWQRLLVRIMGLRVDMTSLCDTDGRSFVKP